MFGNRRPGNAEAQAARWRNLAEAASRDLHTIEALRPAEAIEFIASRAAEERVRREAAERARGERKSRAAKLQSATPYPPDNGSTPPSRGLAL